MMFGSGTSRRRGPAQLMDDESLIVEPAGPRLRLVPLPNINSKAIPLFARSHGRDAHGTEPLLLTQGRKPFTLVSCLLNV